MQVLKPVYHTQEILPLIERSMDAGWTGYGPMCAEFEQRWCEYADVDNALFLNSATAGLHLALECLKDGRSKVITTPITFVSTNHAILYAGLTPVFADVDSSLNLNPQSVEAYIDSDTLAVMFVAIGGNAQNYREIREVCDRHGVYLILDGAHAVGTTLPRVFDGVIVADSQIGWDADASVFSFQAVKNLPTADSGLITFKDKARHERAKRLSWMGIDRNTFSRSAGSYKWGYDVPELGWKYNGNDIMACMAIVGLNHLQADKKHRNTLARCYEQWLVEFIPHLEGSSRHLFQVLVADREKTLNELKAKDIHCGVHYASNRTYPMFAGCAGKTPYADWVSDHMISLPLHLEITLWEVEKVCHLLS
jgi:dTDP-4-amino-4,6-dideoxygalactose transaminase